MQNMFSKCPACRGQLIITECRCTQCQLQIRGEFHPGRLFSLSEDELTFIQVFLSARGNLSEVERILGISYPTIRHKLDEINRIMNQNIAGLEAVGRLEVTEPDNGGKASSRKEILQKVADGEITPADAVEIFNQVAGEPES
jgi:hypothetical protein